MAYPCRSPGANHALDAWAAAEQSRAARAAARGRSPREPRSRAKVGAFCGFVFGWLVGLSVGWLVGWTLDWFVLIG